MDFQTKQNIYFAISAFLLFFVALLMFLANINRNQTNMNPVLAYAIMYHNLIMFLMIIIAVSFGFMWSQISYREIQKTKQESHTMMDTVFMFLGEDEKHIINFLVQHEGKTTQAEISRLEGMTRVKAFRCLKRLEDKRLVRVVAHGKSRRVFLREHIMHALQEL